MKRLLADQGEPCFAIVVEQHLPQSVYAAGELRFYLGMITGVPFEIADAAEGNRIRLDQRELPELGHDGFRLETAETELTITGGVRGIIYGVYEFLEQLGCRFFTTEAEKVPYVPEAEMPELHLQKKPLLEYRMHYTYDFNHCFRFAAKLRINGSDIPEKFGGGMKYVWFVHSLDHIIPQAEFAQTHPEYFAMRNGKRFLPEKAGDGQRCLTNPDVLEISVERVRAALKSHPECRMISISQLDNMNFCTCPECAKVDAEEGSSAGTVLRFVNAVASRLRDEFPDVIFDTLAYVYSRPAPKLVRPAENVCVRLCSIECCFAHTFDKCDDTTWWAKRPDGTRTSFLSDLRDWSRICDRLYVWDYVTQFSHYPVPFPNWHTLQPNLQTMVENNVKGVFEQGHSARGGGADLLELRQYLIAKLLWDPYCDLERHMTEFLEYFYGPAAPVIREYIETICSKCEKDNIHVYFNDRPTGQHLEEPMLDQYDEILSRAEAAVGNADPLYRVRIKRIQLGLRYVRLKRDSMLRDRNDPEALNRFFSEWRAYGFTCPHESASAESAHRAFLKKCWRGEELDEPQYEFGDTQ